MALGIDIYRYQTVTDWKAVKNAGVSFVYVKATDGSGYAPVRADNQVNGAHGVGLPVGVYHFCQPGDPVAQANVLLSEVRRLDATGLGPALDLEDNPTGTGKANIPDSQKTGWAKTFLGVVAAAGYRPVVYMSSALAKTLRPDQWGIPNLVIWIASYGPNNGQRNALTGGYPGRVDIHQYTSVGHVPGITGQVDLNEALTDVEDDMPITESDAQTLLGAPVCATVDPGTEQSGPPYVSLSEHARYGRWYAEKGTWIGLRIESAIKGLSDLVAKQNGVTAEEIAAALGPTLLAGLADNMSHLSDDEITAIAKATADEADRRAVIRANTNV